MRVKGMMCPYGYVTEFETLCWLSHLKSLTGRSNQIIYIVGLFSNGLGCWKETVVLWHCKASYDCYRILPLVQHIGFLNELIYREKLNLFRITLKGTGKERNDFLLFHFKPFPSRLQFNSICVCLSLLQNPLLDSFTWSSCVTFSGKGNTKKCMCRLLDADH